MKNGIPKGLTGEQVKERKKKGLLNLPVEAPSKSVKQIIAGNVFTFFNFIFVALAVCLVLVHRYRQMLFLIAVVINAVIGIIQQLRSKRVVDKLSLLAAAKYPVLRDGEETECPSDELVQDDIIILKAGAQIPADAVVEAGELRVSEALITGEADAVYKTGGAELKSGSFVLSGKCYARLTYVGADSYVSRLTVEAKGKGVDKKSEMMNALDKLLHGIAVVLVPFGLLLFFKQHWIIGLSLSDATVAVIAALVGMIPEGLYLLTSVALALSVMRLAKRNTVVHEMSCIETLARVDVLCVDKTGTITEPNMKVSEVVCLDEEHYDREFVEELLNAYYTQMDADNETAMAIRREYDRDVEWEITKKIPFHSKTKWSAVSFKEQGTYVIGAPEMVLGAQYERFSERLEVFADRGERVILIGQYPGEPEEGRPLSAEILPVAFIVIANNIRANAKETFRYFEEQGVAVKVISGDSPATVAKIAGRAGISGAEQFVDARTLETPGQLKEAAERYTVFGRVTPEQKRELIRAIKENGHTTAMTGDGVNDVLALKDADCGIAMASGSDAACHAAHLVLMDSDFSVMPQIVAEGRRVINNIERAAALYLVKNLFSFFMTFILLFVPLTYPLEPIQLTLVSVFTIGIPSFFLALEPNEEMVKGRFLRNVLAKAFPGGLTNVAAVLAVSITSRVFGFSVDVMNTMAGVAIGFVGIMVLAQICIPFDRKRFVIWVSMAALLAVNILFLGNVYALVPLNIPQMIVLLIIMGGSYPVLMFMLGMVPTVIRLWNRLRQKWRKRL